MAEIDRARIKSIYAQIKGYHDSLPTDGDAPKAAVNRYNELLGELTQISRTEYDRFKVQERHIPGDQFNSAYTFLDHDDVNMSMSAVLGRLEADFNLKENVPITQPVVVVNQNQQVSVSVQSIAQLVSSQTNDENKELLLELEEALRAKNETMAKSALRKILDKSWDLFLAVLPVLLEAWGRPRR